MKVLRFLYLAACFAFCLSAGAQRQAWLPVTPQDLAVRDVPGNPGAPAIQLYYSQYINDRDENNEGEYIYNRIKVLNEKGTRYADVEIRLPEGFTLSDLKARTIHPDGKIIDFLGKPFDKIVAKGKGFKDLAKTFTLPEVTVGSILEYRYKLDYPANTLPAHEWIVQRELYTVKEEFGIRSYTGPIKGIDGPVGLILFQTLPRNAKVQKKGEGFELEIENVPAFEGEAYMPPRATYLYHVTMAYGGREMTSSEKFWRDAGMRWNDEAERFIGDYREIRSAAEAVTGDEPDQEKKLRKLYDCAQKVRNLTYERERTEVELRAENLKPNQNAGEVLNRGYGNRIDITRFFVALARAAGFNAFILKISDRSERFFDPNLLYADQLDTEIALVSLNGKNVDLDPGTRLCPYGLLRWMRTSTRALQLDKKGGAFVEVPMAPYNSAMVTRTVKAALDDQGTLKGDLFVQFDGSEALERRLRALAMDEAGRTKMLEDEVREWLPHGAQAKLTAARGWESTGEPLAASFAITVPSYASIAGKRMLVAGQLFQAQQAEAFKPQERRFPVYFPYAFAEDDKINIQVPAGFSMESVPQQQAANIGFAGYQCVSRFENGELSTTRVLKVNGIFFRTEQYPQLRDFFNKVQAGDEQQAVMQGRSIHAQN
ncbi:MAG TPA: DUF3857 domain-containing protein [Candidatus Angelobacter sp.]|nr:DUF3857 domain-containing protein [Candidatus Angelobacter sp.]